jgi:hypothetical protein
MSRKLERSEVIFLLMMVPWYAALALHTTSDLTWFLYFLPFWVLPPVMWFAKRRRPKVSSPPDVCTRCGYSLTGSVSGVCPECGMRANAESDVR